MKEKTMFNAKTLCDEVGDCRQCFEYLTFRCSVLNRHTCGSRGQLQRSYVEGNPEWRVGCTKDECKTAKGYGPFSSKLEAMTFWNKKFNYVTRGETHESK